MPIEIAGVITGIEFITKNKRNMRLKPVESIWKKKWIETRYMFLLLLDFD